MKPKIFLCLVLGCLSFTFVVRSCSEERKQSSASEEEALWSYAEDYYLRNTSEAVHLLDSLAKIPADSKEAKTVFKKVRIAFKKAEAYAAYLNPPVGHRANGPALAVFLEDTERVMNPIGLQKVEESIYEGGVDPAVFKREVLLTKGLLVHLQNNIKNKKLNPQRFFIATHQQLLRIISLSISGFDTPVSYLGLEEAKISLESLKELYEKTIAETIERKDPHLSWRFKNTVDQAVDFLASHTDFERFDRYTFIREYMNPITRYWVNIRKTSGLWDGVDNRPFNFDAPTFFEKDAFNLKYFTPPVNRSPTEAEIRLGKKLFYDPNLSESKKMACATCHIPEKAFADERVVNLDNTDRPLKRNTPTLVNAAFQKSFFWDGRSATLLDQISSVFTNKQEFDSNVHQFSDAILMDSSYVRLFKEAFGDIPKKNREVIRAISSYISTLNGFDSKFDRNIRGEEDTFTEEEKRGFNLYTGKALCATCHFIPLTNGTVPPFYSETEKEVIGVPEDANNKMMDDDLGFYWRFNKEIHRGMFKTPTVRNIALTAPYMHNGAYRTLEEVMDFYNQGGGKGLGFDLEQQTLPFDELNLSEEEIEALISFLRTLTDLPPEAGVQS